MVNKIIIITTAISRIDIHNICFPLYKKFIGTEYDVKWFINVDTPTYCQDSADDVEKNFRNILSEPNYDLFINKSTFANFFNAVKTLLKLSLSHLTNDCCVLWLEDDWILNKDCDLKYLIDNFVKETSVVSLVYNLLGSFPPFIMGHQIAKLFYSHFVRLNQPNQNPEKVSRRIMRALAKKMGVIYYSYFDNLDQLENIKNYSRNGNNFILRGQGLFYKETYLQISDCRILCKSDSGSENINTNSENLNSDILLINNLDHYKILTTNKIIFVRFGTGQNYANYSNSYFRDIGRDWKKNILAKQKI